MVVYATEAYAPVTCKLNDCKYFKLYEIQINELINFLQTFKYSKICRIRHIETWSIHNIYFGFWYVDHQTHK